MSRSIDCPMCGHVETRVYDSRRTTVFDCPAVHRRRRCMGCSGKFSTYEVVTAEAASMLQRDALGASLTAVKRARDALDDVTTYVSVAQNNGVGGVD